MRISTARLRGRAVLRDADEEHRASTPLELLFDLTFVVAVGRAAAALHHELVEGHYLDGLIGFTTVFFAVWWAWMNYTWFASAHDSDDVAHRLLTLVQMVGVLVLAAGVTQAVEDDSWGIVTAGYVIMRIGLVGAWLRVARDERATRPRAVRYAIAITALQVLWIARLALGSEFGLASFAVLAALEMLSPMWAERSTGRPLFHAGHIEERYGLFTIIVLGESLLSAAAGFQTAFDEQGLTGGLLLVGLSGIALAFGTWWLYFDHPGHLTPTAGVAFRWGYAHVAVFASLAALGAGVHVAIEAVTDHAEDRVGALAVALPVAAYLLGLALLMVVTGTPLTSRRVLPKLAGAAVIVAVGAVAPVTAAVVVCAVIVAGLVTSMVVLPEREDHA
jgi:low temperature requirement protein LtrA